MSSRTKSKSSNGPSVIHNIEDVLTKIDTGKKNGHPSMTFKQGSFHQMKKISTSSSSSRLGMSQNRREISDQGFKQTSSEDDSNLSPTSSSSSSSMSKSSKRLGRLEEKVQKSSYLNTTNKRKQKKGIKLIQALKSQLQKIENEVDHSQYGDILTRLRTMRDDVKNKTTNSHDGPSNKEHPLYTELSNIFEYWSGLNLTDAECCHSEESMYYIPDFEEDEVTETTAECTSTISSSASVVTKSSIVSIGSVDIISQQVHESKIMDSNEERGSIDEDSSSLTALTVPHRKCIDLLEERPTSHSNIVSDDSEEGISEGTASDEEDDDHDLSEDEEKEGDDQALQPSSCFMKKSPFQPQTIEPEDTIKTNTYDPAPFDLDFDSCLTVGILEAVVEDSDYDSDDSSSCTDNNNDSFAENTETKTVRPPKRVAFKDVKPSAQDALARARALLDNARSMQKNMA